jgi:hypothetical protein
MNDGAPTEFLLSPGPSAEGDAIEAFRRILRGEAAVLLDRAMQPISELLAAGEGERISVRVLSVARSVRVEIRDDGAGVVLGGLRSHGSPVSHGWSPHLLSRVADRWGSVSGADGAWVWFELDLPRGGT